MNEHELSNLLHEAAGDATVSSNPPRRVLRRTRLHMAATGALAVSSIVLMAGVGFALATNSTATSVRETASSPLVKAPEASASDQLLDDRETLLAEVQESGDQTWTFSGWVQRSDKLCLSSTTHSESTASGMGNCVDFGVPEHRHLGFIELDASDHDRYEVLGTVSTDVLRLDFEDESGDAQSVTIIDAPDELGTDRNFFFLLVPPGTQGELEAQDANGEVLQRERLCLPKGGTACTVGFLPDVSGLGPPLIPASLEMACDEMTPGDVRRLTAEPTPEQALSRWIVSLDLDLTADEFELERIDPETVGMSLPARKGRSAAYALLSKDGDQQWSIVELLYCQGIVDPDSSKPAKGLPPPPPTPSLTPPPPSPSP